MEIISPVTGGKTKYISSIPTKTIIDLYKRYSDVARFFKDINKVDIYECLDTGYRFYHPFSVAGDGPFYEDLSLEPLYYIPWKAEHEVADAYIKPGDVVLEQGCANGDFLLKEKERKNIIPYGTELNEKAQAEAARKGVNFSSTTIANVSCSFQVLEHIADVKSFINEAVIATKPGGYVIFAVPNNETFMKDDPTGFLNMPPHHMGIWNKSVFEKLPAFFPLEFIATHTEVLQPHHYRYFYQRKFGDYLLPLGFLGKVLNKALFELFGKHIIARKAKNITGHTLTAVFKKT